MGSTPARARACPSRPATRRLSLVVPPVPIALKAALYDNPDVGRRGEAGKPTARSAGRPQRTLDILVAGFQHVDARSVVEYVEG